MSIGNTNFITLDSIAEIQDIVNGDYLFTVSNGVIYKLDFQNLILTPDNVDFYSTIESLSTQVVSLTNAFSAVNSQINTLSSLNGVGTVVHDMSAGWTSTNLQVQTLSATTWLPGGSQTVQSGSLLSYVGGSNSWQPLAPGMEGDSLQILDNVPQFTGNSGAYKNIANQSNTYQVNTSTEYVEVVPIISATTNGQNYSYIGITWNVNFNGGQGIGPTINKSALLIQYNDGRASQIITGGNYAIQGGTRGNGEPINFTIIPQADFGNIEARRWATVGGSTTKKLGEFSALGNSNVKYPTTRSFDDDPIIITNVLGSKFDIISTYLGGDPEGVPSKWRYGQWYTPTGGDTPVLWDSAETFLKVYGTEA
jgi:hypothetical protein